MAAPEPSHTQCEVDGAEAFSCCMAGQYFTHCYCYCYCYRYRYQEAQEAQARARNQAGRG